MTPKQFYETLLAEIAVDKATMKQARDKRDELGEILVDAVGARLANPRYFGTGAVAQGTQTQPLHDVDLVVQTDEILPAWRNDPMGALEDITSWFGPEIDGECEIGTHAIKLSLNDTPFTADIVYGRTRAGGGILIPERRGHGSLGRWIATDPEQHRELVLDRNRPYDRAVFSRQVRILKQFNSWCRYRDDQNRKPLASFHITALALHLLDDWIGHDLWTPQFFEEAAAIIHQPLAPPTGIGEPLMARDPDYAAAELKRAGAATRHALTAPDDEVEEILRDVFGDPKLLDEITGQNGVAVTGRGTFVSATSAAAAGTGVRSVPPVRSYGDDAP